MTTTSTTPSTWETILADVTTIINVISPVLDIVSPAIGASVSVASKVLAGAAAAEPNAVALINQITSGAPVTVDQLQAAISAYDAAYVQLDTDIAAKLASTPS